MLRKTNTRNNFEQAITSVKQDGGSPVGMIFFSRERGSWLVYGKMDKAKRKTILEETL